ncbi:30S ribosomal protein S20 [Patescibacteria group bacterium]
MPITKSAKKSLRQSERRKVINIRKKRAMKGKLKEVSKLVSEKKKGVALKMVPETYKAIDKAAKTGIIKKNTASRKKSRLIKAIKRIES